MDNINYINNIINEIIWGPALITLMLGIGLFLSIGTGFFAITKLRYVLKNTMFKISDKRVSGDGEITPFQAVSTALSATVGTGNIAGVATAISLGGPGAIFWMWIAALLGMTTKFAEVVLSVKYREKTQDGRYVGGPMYYIKNGLNNKLLAACFALFGTLASFGIGNMVQSNSVAHAVKSTFNISPFITGVIMAVITSFVIVGGIKKISAVAQVLVPFMALLYIFGGLIILFINYDKVFYAFRLIIDKAFNSTAAVGGFLGSSARDAFRFGIARGVFTNEAGIGSAPIAHAAASTNHPAKQGLWGIFEVFFDTIVMCTITALAILTTGVWTSGKTGAELTSMAFNLVLPNVGDKIVAFGLVMFAFSTIIGWEYYGERCIEYLLGTKSIIFFKLAWVVAVQLGAVGRLEFLWILSDTLNAMMALPNLIALFFLSNYVFKSKKQLFSLQPYNR